MTALAGHPPKHAVFVVATVTGGSVAYVGVAAANRAPLLPTATENPAYILTGDDGGTVAAFDLIDAQSAPTIVAGLSPEDLSAASAALIDDEPPPGTNPLGFPRVPPVSQFDGGPFEGANCTLAAGAMLARLGFGIVTSGSILRTLQDDQVGGTGLDDLQTAIFRGYGVQFKSGAVTPAQLKNLLAAGYGAVIQGDYGEIPPQLRLQPSFDDPHAIYLDGYYPGDASTPPAYYVIDPIGRGPNYDGDWWPASIVDAFGLAFGHGGRIAAAWVFPPGGVAPEVVGPDVLPLPTSPPGPVTPTPAPGESASPSVSPSAGGSPPLPEEPGDVVTPHPVFDPDLVGSVTLDPGILLPVLSICLLEPPPAGCPTGVEAVFEVPQPPIIDLSLGPEIEVVFVDSDRPNVAFVGFRTDPPSPVDVRFWEADGTPATFMSASSMASVVILGQPTVVARLDVSAATTYHFQVSAGDGLFATESPIGTFTTGPGVSAFDVALESEASPAFELASGISPYVHLAEDAFALPLLEIVGGSPPEACLDLVIDFGGSPYCPALETALEGACETATVTYELSGVEATGVLIRAFPTETGELPDGTETLSGILEAEGPPDAGEVSIGCLASGLSYSVVLDAIGDADGILASEVVTIP